jgi:death-on-curing protein
LATEPTKYLTFAEALLHHIELMRALGESRFGIFDRALLESALARPRHAASYDNADLPAQAATLCYGLIKDHPRVGGNKRTATHLTDHFLRTNGREIVATNSEVKMVTSVESDQMDLGTLTQWMIDHVQAVEQ